MEDKTIKVRCINNGNMEQEALKIGKIYDAMESEYIKGAYEILSDDSNRKNMNYSKNWFEEVKEDILMVECINNNHAKDRLIIGKKYPVINQDKDFYIINDETTEAQSWGKSRFKPVPKEKEVKKFTFKEVIANIKKNEKYTDGTSIISMNDSETTIEGSKISFTYSEDYREFIKVEEFKTLEHTKECQHNEKEIENLKTEHSKTIKSQDKRLESAYDERCDLINNNGELKAQLENELGRNRILNEKLEDREEETKEKLENYKLLKRMVKVLLEGL